MRFCLLAAAIAFAESTILTGMFMFAGQSFNIVATAPVLHEQTGLMTIFGNLVFAPFVETA